MKFMIVIAASVTSATLVVPTVSQGQESGAASKSQVAAVSDKQLRV